MPRSDYLLDDKVLWCLTLLHRDTLWQGLHTLLHPLTYPATRQNLSELVKLTFKHLALALEGVIHLPTLEEWRMMNDGAGSDAFPGALLFFIDGTSVPCRKPAHAWLRRKLWVNYKKHHAGRYFVICTADGTIVFISQIEAGSISDTKEYARSDIRKTLSRLYGPQRRNLQGDEHFVLGGDKGYIYCQPPKHFQLILTKSADQELAEGSFQTFGDSEIGSASFTSSKEMCRPRAVIERSIGRIKRFSALSSGRMRWKDAYPLEEMIFIAAVIANDHITQKKYSKIFE